MKDHRQQVHDTGAVVLAAGTSSRMGQLKALMPLDGVPMLRRNLDLFQRSGFGDIWVVTGHEAPQVRRLAEEMGHKTIHNPHYLQGMFTSIQAGIRAAKNCPSGCFLIPVDYPLVKQDTLDSLLGAVQGNPGKWVVPTFRGKKGHPLFVPADYFEEILAYGGEDGLKAITDKYRDQFVKVAVEDQGVVMDVDDKAAYEYAIRYIADGSKPMNLARTVGEQRFILIRHGQTRQHRGKILLGQTDVPLSELGRKQAEQAGADLMNLANPSTIFASDLSRARETAEIIARRFPGCQVVSKTFLREMNLGRWDGKDVEEILKSEPEEFAYRGSHLMEYKRGNGAENFYDLQYRAIRGMIHLLEEKSGQAPQDVVIVAHQSVLRAIFNNLRGMDISDAWEPMKNGEIRVATSWIKRK